MKLQTKISDILKIHAAESSSMSAIAKTNAAKDAVERAIHYGSANAPDISAVIASARAAVIANTDAEKALAKVPADRRTMASKSIIIGNEIARAAARLGDSYSGDTGYGVRFGEVAGAETVTGKGDSYSRSCKYSKTNASHVVTISAAGLPCLVESEALRLCSIGDGLHLISLMEDGAAVWVRSKGKAIVSESGWIAGNGVACYHSTKSAADAQYCFARKMSVIEREQKLAKAAGKVERRARLIARLCGSAVATLGDAKKLGYCDAGIAAFQAAHSIGDSAALPDLVRTGNASAIALALSVARKMSRKAELA